MAFVYLDRFALKQTFYNTENFYAKQDAGFISGKTGLALELAVLASAMKNGIPALLVDLTNSIRHGDVCLMGGSDPHLIEVKSGKRIKRSGKKQAKSIAQLHDFFETDYATGLHGAPESHRSAHTIPERLYVEEMNECIAESYVHGYAVRAPEPGLFYVSMTDAAPNVGTILAEIKPRRPWAFFLNETKATRSWSPYTPFVLTIKKREHLYDFIRGNLTILVMLEPDALCEHAAKKGVSATIDADNEEYPLRIEGDSGFRISNHILNRIPLEFASPE
jgi:hypothetical protein